jgi:malate synthase
MEDLATDRIYRLMIAQRMLHRDTVVVTDSDGRRVDHTPELVTELFDQELERIIRELPEQTDEATLEIYRRARQISEEMITRGWFDPI